MSLKPRLVLTSALTFVAFGVFPGCGGDASNASTEDSLFAINPRTGQKGAFGDDTDVPSGWVPCTSEHDCPAMVPCTDLVETDCVTRDDCEPTGTDAGCADTDAETTTTDDCAGIPECALSCGPDQHNPVDANGCTHSCECVPNGDECTEAECGPAPGCPAELCSDGSIGGCTGRCIRRDSGTCGWEIRTCPPGPDNLQWYETCGDPSCREGGHRDSGLPTCTSETIGDSCTKDGAKCDPVNDCNSHVICSDSDPRMSAGGCPISRREFKREINYLTAEDRARYTSEILSTRLATYRYHAAPERLHLGFIIEDQEPNEAIDSARDRVDLYAYTSMAVAAVQTQQEELAQLRSEVAELRALLKGSDAPVCR